MELITPDIRQGGPLPILVSSRPLDFERLRALPLVKLEYDWDGRPLAAETSFLLALDGEHLFFLAACRQRPEVDPAQTPGGFAEGIWRHDAAEFFLGEDGSVRYQEFNLSPAGAWWSGVFESYRELDPRVDGRALKAVTRAEVEAGGWRAELAVRREALGVAAAFDGQTRANVSFIIGGRLRQHISWSRLPSTKPDFHLCQEFRRLRILELP